MSFKNQIRNQSNPQNKNNQNFTVNSMVQIEKDDDCDQFLQAI